MDEEFRDGESMDEEPRDGESKVEEYRDGESKDEEYRNGESRDGESKDGFTPWPQQVTSLQSHSMTLDVTIMLHQVGQRCLQSF